MPDLLAVDLDQYYNSLKKIMKRQTDHHGRRRWRSKKRIKRKIYIWTKYIYFLFNLFFCFLLHHLVVRIRLPFHDFVLFLFFLSPFLALVSRFSFLVPCFRNIHSHKQFLVGWKLSVPIKLMCHFSNVNSSFVRNDIIFRYIVKKCLVATVRKDGPEKRKPLCI